jgi:hypothetical protein
MDDQRFDDFARLIGSGSSRRRLLKLLGGLFAGGAGVALGRNLSAAQETCIAAGEACACSDGVCGGSHCCTSYCQDGVCCDDGGGACTANIQCCGGSCNDGFCCLSGAEECTDDGQCCNGSCIGGVCHAEGTCLPDDEVCGADFQCCSGLCLREHCWSCADRACLDDGDCCLGYACIGAGESSAYGNCSSTGEPACAGEGEACDANPVPAADPYTLCCDGYVCANNICVVVTAPAECEVDADCVVGAAGDIEGGICCRGACRQIECCIEDADPNARCAEGATCFEGLCVFVCKGDADCTDGTCCCGDGTCHAACCNDGTDTPPVDSDGETSGVTTLPGTGTDDGDEANGAITGLLGFGLAAGAAAYLAGRTDKSSEQA